MITRVFLCCLLLSLLIGAPLQAGDRALIKQQMLQWEKEMDQLQSGLYRHQFKKMEQAMNAMANSRPLPASIDRALKASLKEREYKDYLQIDRYIRSNAQKVADMASQGDIQKLLFHQGRLLIACIQCHDMFLGKAVQAVEKPELQ